MGRVEYKRIEGYERLADEFVDYMIEYYHFQSTPSEHLYYRLVDELIERGIIKRETYDEKNGRVFYVKMPPPLKLPALPITK